MWGGVRLGSRIPDLRLVEKEEKVGRTKEIVTRTGTSTKHEQMRVISWRKIVILVNRYSREKKKKGQGRVRRREKEGGCKRERNSLIQPDSSRSTPLLVDCEGPSERQLLV